MVASKKKTGTAVDKTDESALALYEGETETGFEGTTSDDYAIPFLKLLQKNSPEVDEDSGSALEGAKAGMYFNTSTGQLYEEVVVVPCHYHRAMVEWKDRDEGGGFVGQHPVDYVAGMDRDKRGRFLPGNGNYISDTRYFFCLQETDDGVEPVVLSFASTQLKKARSWMTRMQNLKAAGEGGKRFTLPMFANKYRLTSVPEQNDQGSWRGYKIDLVERIDDPAIAQAAKDARDMFRSAASTIKPVEESGDGPEKGSASPAKDDEIPF